MSQGRLKQWVSSSHLVWLGVTILWLGVAAVFRPLTLPDEGRYVGIAWEMLTSGDWLVPHLDGLPYFHKPPLFYWLTAASLNVCGPHLLCSRVVPLLSSIVMAIALFRFLFLYLNKRTAVMAFVVLVTQPFFFASAQFANLDMLVACMISLTILSAAEFVWSIDRERPAEHHLMLTMFFAVGGILAKGLIGVVLPAAVVFFWLLASGRLAYTKHFFWWPAVAVFLLLVSPWFLLMESQFKGFLDYFFIHHHFQRFAGSNFNNQEPFWFYLPALLLLTLPSSLWLLRFRRRDLQLWTPMQRDIGLLMLCWLGFILLFFSIPVSKPLGYIMPVLPALATLTALLMVQACQDPVFKRRSLWLTLAVSIVACVIAIMTVIQHAKKVASYQLAMQVQSLAHTNDQLVMLGKYQFDLPFYLHLSKPAWVVADWQAAAREVLDDSWEKELLEAKRFNPQVAAENLLSDQQLAQQICRLQASQSLWVAGDPGSAAHLPLLANIAPQAKVRDHYLWRISPAQIESACTKM
jgi:4-amino-4-deoxy-L-arabinose transferase-like glycosyltransferase